MMFKKVLLNFIFLLVYFKNILSKLRVSVLNKQEKQLPLKGKVFKAGLLSNVHHYTRNETFMLPQGPIFAKGWLKYYVYEKNDANKLSDFFKNFEFYDQFKGGIVKNLNLADNVFK